MFYSLLPVSLSLILYGTMGLFILAGALRGHRKGFKADLFWLITNILFWVSFVIIVETYITREFIENPQFLTLAQSFGLETGTSTNLVEYGADYASNQFSIDAAVITQDALLDIVFAIVQIVVKIVVLPVYAIVYHLVVALLYLIIFRRFFKPKKIKIEKYSAKLDRKKVDSARKAELIEKAEKRNRKSKVSKNIGWITGLVRGGLSALVFLSIFNSFINLLPTLESLNSNYSAEEGGSSTNTEVSRMNLYDYISLQFGDVVDIKEICDYINEYRNGTLAHITDVKVGEKTLDAFVVDLLLEGKSNDFSLSIREEIMQVVKIADYACELTNGFDLNNIDYLALNANQITCLENIIIILSDDKLVKNLGEAALSVALSLDAVKDMIPEGIEIPEINIDLSQELKSIAGMVKDAYSLIGEDKKIDYNNLDPDVVESLISKISELQTVQVVCQVGSAFAVDQFFAEKDEAGNVTNQAKLDSMKESLADVVWKEDITDLGSLYRKYLDLGIAGLQESCKDEEGKLNTIKLVTSLKNDKLNAIIETIFETDFLTAIMPDVMEIVRNKYIPEDYKDMISPNITTAAGWEAELKSLLTIVKDLTQDGTRPLEAMDKLDFSILKDLSTRTIVSSELLSYAMIGILIDASNGEGLVGEALGDYIAMPTELKAAADSTTHKYNAKWYSTSSEEGELEVMLDALKNIASSVSSLDNIMGSITDVLDAIDPNDFEKSEVLHFTVSKLLLENAGDFLKIPTTSFMSDAELGVDAGASVIKASEITDIIDILTDENIFNIKSLMAYKNKNDTEAPALKYEEYNELSEEEKANYTAEFSTNLDIGSVSGILTNKTLYDPDSTEAIEIKDANLNKLFGSAILRTTISYFINEYAGDFITMPSTEGRYEMVNVYAAEGNETIKALSLDECKNLVKAIDLLDIDFESISDNPLSLMDTFKNNNKAEKIFGKEINSTANPDYSETIHFTVSEILLDKAGDFLKVPTTSFMDASAFDDTTLNIIKSEEIVKLLEILSDENVFNLNTLMSYKNKNDTEAPVLKYEQYKLLNEEAKANYTSEFDTNLDIGGITGILTSKTLYDPDSTEEVEIKDANLNKLFGSAILRTTISFFINEYASDFVVMPSSTGSFEMINVYAAEGNESIKVLSISESKNLVKTIDILDLDFEALSDDPLAIVDSFKDQEGHYKNTNTAKIFAATIDSNPNPDYSETFHATLSKFVFDFASDNAGNDFTVKIPDEAKDAEYLVFDEIDAFLKGMCALDVNSLVSGGNISIVSLIYDNQNISDAFDSKIIRFSITSYLENSNATKDFLSIPTTGSSIEKLNYNATQVNVLTKAELTNIFGGFKTLIEEQYIYLNPTVKVEDRKPNTLSDNALMNPSAKAIKNASDDMFKSIVILKLVSSKIDDMAGSSGSLSIIVPADVYDSTEGIIAATELTSLIGGLCEITGGGSISDMSIDSDNLINDLGQKDDAMVSTIFASSILRASMTNSVKGISALKIPHDVTVIEENELDKAGNSIDILKTEEIVKLVKLFNQIGSGTGGLNALDVSTLSIDKLISMMNDLAEDDDTGSKISGIFRATLADKLLELNSTSAIYVGIEGNFVNAENQSLIEYNNSYEAPTKANYANINYIKYTEIDKMFKSIKVLLGTSSNTSLTSLSGDSFTSNTGNMLSLGETEIATLFASDIMVSTMSVIISGLFKEPGTLKYLSEDKVDEPFHYTQYNLPREELENFYRAIQIVMPAGATNIDNMQLDFESIIVKLADPDKVSKLTASKLLSYNIKNYLISLNAASNGFNNMLALANCNCSEHAGCVHNYNRYYYAVNADGTTANNDLVGLLNSFALIYGNSEFVKAFKDTQNADMSVLTSKAFIDTICGNGSSNVIVDSLPNMIEQFKSRITTLVNAINAAIDIANSSPLSSPKIAKLNLSFYIPDKFYETTKFPDYATWQSYWYGDLANSTTGYQEGQLYKFFNVITVASSISIYNLTPLTDAMNACELTVLS